MAASQIDRANGRLKNDYTNREQQQQKRRHATLSKQATFAALSRNNGNNKCLSVSVCPSEPLPPTNSMLAHSCGSPVRHECACLCRPGPTCYGCATCTISKSAQSASCVCAPLPVQAPAPLVEHKAQERRRARPSPATCCCCCFSCCRCRSVLSRGAFRLSAFSIVWMRPMQKLAIRNRDETGRLANERAQLTSSNSHSDSHSHKWMDHTIKRDQLRRRR